MPTIRTDAVVYRKDLYPRFEPDPKTIQTYSECIEQLPPIEVSQDNILIDGYHRWKAHETAKVDEIPCIITRVASEMELLMLAVRRNAKHGKQLTGEEKKRYAIQWWNVLPEADIIDALSISERSFRDWTQAKRESQEEAVKQSIYDLWMECRTQKEIAEALNLPPKTVSNKIAEFGQNGSDADLAIFRNFIESEDGEKSDRQLYSVWNFPKATNEVKHFGNIPPEIVDNLLFYYTKLFDVVFDPFGGGGSTLDKCRERKRRYYVSDLNPVPSREHQIRKHDITTGLPKDLPVPDLVFLDPPYWQQAKERYSQDETDLGNVSLESFLDTIGNIAKLVKRKWTADHSGTLALIIGPWKQGGDYVDLAFLCYERIAKYLRLRNRIIVPYSTQVHGGKFVKIAKDKKEILYLHRDLMVFGLDVNGY